MNLPESYVEEGLLLAEDLFIFGVPAKSLTKTELLASMGQTAKAYDNQLRESYRRAKVFREMFQ